MSPAAFFEPANYAANGYAIPYLLAAILTLGIAVTVSVREKKSWNTATFLLLILTAASWLFCYLGITLSANVSMAYEWCRIHTSIIVTIPAMVLIFTLSAVGKFREYQNWVLLSLLLSAGFVSSVWTTPFFVLEPSKYFWGYYPRYGTLSFLFLGYFFFVLLGSLCVFHKEEKKTVSPLTRKRLRIFFSAFLAAYFASVDYLPMYGLEIYPFGYIPFVIGLSLLAYGVVCYRLTDITPSYAAEQIIKTMPDGLLVIDREHRVRVANKKAEELFSRKGESLTGTLISASGIPFFQEANLKRLLEVASSNTYEITFPSPSGRDLTGVLSTSILQSKSGDNIAVICIIKDITSRKEAERLLEERENHYRLLAENVTDLIWTMNREFQFTYVSPSVFSLRGYSPEEAMKQTLVETFTVASHGAAFKLFSELLAAKTMGTAFETKSIELEYRCKSGMPLPVQLKVSFVPGENGMPDQILGISKDITELELTRKNLEAGEKQYRELIQTLPDPVITLDHQGCVAFINRAAERLLGFPNDELKGKHITKAHLVSDASLAGTIQEVGAMILGRNPASFPIEMVSRSSQTIPVTAASRIYRRSRNLFYIELFLTLSENEKAA